MLCRIPLFLVAHLIALLWASRAVLFLSELSSEEQHQSLVVSWVTLFSCWAMLLNGFPNEEKFSSFLHVSAYTFLIVLLKVKNVPLAQFYHTVDRMKNTLACDLVLRCPGPACQLEDRSSSLPHLPRVTVG